jgi:predicted PurR-regulated permease PerM
MNVIPYLGPVFGISIGLLLGIANSMELEFYTELLPRILYMAMVFVVYQIIDNMFFQPFIFGTSVKAHPLEIFLVIIIGGSLAGVVGLILAVPAYTVIRVFAKEFFDEYKVVQKITERL